MACTVLHAGKATILVIVQAGLVINYYPFIFHAHGLGRADLDTAVALDAANSANIHDCPQLVSRVAADMDPGPPWIELQNSTWADINAGAATNAEPLVDVDHAVSDLHGPEWASLDTVTIAKTGMGADIHTATHHTGRGT